MKTIYFNARSLMNKINNLQSLLNTNDYDLIAVTETWLTPTIPNSLLIQNTNYNLLRKDRLSQVGGGAAIFISKRYSIIPVEIKSRFSELDAIVTDVCFKERKRYRFVCIYFPPSKTLDEYSISNLCEFIDFCSSDCDFPIIYFGDFNFPNIDWSVPSCTGSTCQSKFLSSVITNNLKQFIHEPTRDRNILDLLLTNEPSIILDVNISAPFTQSCDHDSIGVTIAIPPLQELINKKRRNFRKADYDGINKYLSTINWISLFQNSDRNVESFWGKISLILDYCIENFVPFSMKSKGKRTRPPKKLRKLAVKKKSLYKASKIDHSKKESYKEVSREYEKTVKDLNVEYESALMDEPSLSKFYSFIKGKLQQQETVPALQRNDSTLVTDDDEKAEILNSYFSSVFTLDNHIVPEISSSLPTNTFLPFIEFSYAKVLSVLKKLPSKTSRSPDGYPAFFFKYIASEIAIPLCLLFELSLKTGACLLFGKPL